MKREYDFRGMTGVRGKYHEAMKNGYTTIIHKSDGTTETIEARPIFLEQDLKAQFPTSESVHDELLGFIGIEKTES